MTAPTRPLVIVCRDEVSLGELLPRFGDEGARALSEGRVFVGAHRARDHRDRVARGDQVVVYPSRTLESEAVYTLAREAGIVAAYKPARMATIADHRGSTGTLEHEVGRLLGVHGLHPTSRLDVG